MCTLIELSDKRECTVIYQFIIVKHITIGSSSKNAMTSTTVIGCLKVKNFTYGMRYSDQLFYSGCNHQLNWKKHSVHTKP